MAIRSERVGRVLECSMCLTDYFDHPLSNQLCMHCYKDFITFKDLEDDYEYPLDEYELSLIHI